MSTDHPRPVAGDPGWTVVHERFAPMLEVLGTEFGGPWSIEPYTGRVDEHGVWLILGGVYRDGEQVGLINIGPHRDVITPQTSLDPGCGWGVMATRVSPECAPVITDRRYWPPDRPMPNVNIVSGGNLFTLFSEPFIPLFGYGVEELPMVVAEAVAWIREP